MDTPRRHGLAVLLALATLVIGVVWFVHGLSAEREEARARWDEREPAAYSYVYGYCGGMCANCPVTITVRDGVVTDATVEDRGCSAPDPEDAATVEDLFDIAEAHQPWPFGDTTISYDPYWGFPTGISFTCGEGVQDCGGGWSARDFDVLS